MMNFSSLFNLETDSRKIRPGDTFLAYPGEHRDGRNFIPQAISAGAASIIWEEEDFCWQPDWRLLNFPVRNLRARAGEIADEVYRHPSQKIRVIGVTGTNGKTSVSHWVAEAMLSLGKKTAIIGTLGSGFPGKLRPAVNTTPDGVALQKRLAEFVADDVEAVAMEVSSHALSQHRVAGIRFHSAILTNLSRDHLDYHLDMDSYARAKESLFLSAGLEHAILNFDDELGRKIARKLKDVPTVGYGFGEAAGDRILAGRNLNVENGIAFDIESSWGSGRVESRAVGRFNAANLLATLAALLVQDIALADAISALSAIEPVPGRMQLLGGNENPLVVVDYAHTPDALENVLATLREVVPSRGKLISLFGCGGDRDPGKRPLMGEISERLADETILTDDNPRSEDPREILRQISSGMKKAHSVVHGRREAIMKAIKSAEKEDVILIAGKGHEDYQEEKGVRSPFSDFAVAEEALRERKS